MAIHKPILVKEVLENLNVRAGGHYIDATVGEGGHAVGIAKRNASVLGIDQDPAILEEAKIQIQEAGVGDRVKLAQGNFREIDEISAESGFTDIDGILFDLGLSSWQLERSGRGFSFQKDEPLDMRADPNLKVTAADLLNGLTKDELEELFRKYGEEERASQLAASIVRARSLDPFFKTGDLIAAIEEVRGGGAGRQKLHPATKIFQALRIAVNDEVENLRSVLPRAFGILKPGGRMVVISFHSLEDREVKRFFMEMGRECLGLILTRRPIRPSVEEVLINPRCRSARLRVIEKK